MRMQEIKVMAKTMGIMMMKTMKKTELIRAIQEAEGYSPCFATMNPMKCSQMDCLWRRDCTTEMKNMN
jgi:hypothetical protein